MGWSAIVVMLVELFGPLIAEWLRKFIEEKLRVAAASMDPIEKYPDQARATAALWEQAIAGLPRWAWARRALFRRMRAVSCRIAAEGGKLTADELIELADVGAAAANE